MTKRYIEPKMETVELDSVELLSHSGDLNEGQENACEHGSHAPFCQ